MKKYMIIIALVFSGLSFSFAYETAYIKAMEKQLKALGKAETSSELQNVANGFNRISEMNEGEWLPDYYAALALINAGFKSKEGIKVKDAYYYEAKKHIEKAIKAEGENSELIALKGYALMAELTADPAGRGQHMSGQVMNAFGTAISMDPNNPRAMILMAQMELGMARFFGQGPEKACKMAQNAMQLFLIEEAGTVDNALLPRWGKKNAETMIANCK